jgi:NAD(P)-dependent dehydrogenase (short-subunit alcohol dehydrogenase family)
LKQEEREEQQKVAIVTGSSSGIGYATSLLLARNRFHTYATMRNIGKSADIQEIANKERLPLEVIQLDVKDDASIRDSIEKVESENERIDVLVNNAGYGLVGAFEDLSVEEIKSQFETNFVWCTMTNTTSSSYYEEAEIRYDSKYKFRCRAYWFSRHVCICKQQVCFGRSKRINVI